MFGIASGVHINPSLLNPILSFTMLRFFNPHFSCWVSPTQALYRWYADQIGDIAEPAVPAPAPAATDTAAPALGVPQCQFIIKVNLPA